MTKRILLSLIPFAMLNLWALAVTSQGFLELSARSRFEVLYFLFGKEKHRLRADQAAEAAEHFASKVRPALFVIINIIAAGFAVFAFTHP
jgi:hypothetical protein